MGSSSSCIRQPLCQMPVNEALRGEGDLPAVHASYFPPQSNSWTVQLDRRLTVVS